MTLTCFIMREQRTFTELVDEACLRAAGYSDANAS